MTKTQPVNLEEQEFHYSPHGTKYKILNEGESNHVIVYPDTFIMEKDRLFLFEEFLSALGDNFAFFTRRIIMDAIATEIQNANVEEIGKKVKDEFLKKWIPQESDNRPSTLMQRPINRWG
jgi:hypothetical protein